MCKKREMWADVMEEFFFVFEEMGADSRFQDSNRHVEMLTFGSLLGWPWSRQGQRPTSVSGPA